MLISVHPGVFHPGFFFSTKLLLNAIAQQDLKGKNFLELGAGAGMISVYAAKRGANVTATDISTESILALRQNRLQNSVEFDIIRSDLFEEIPEQSFDIIAINPPYYKKNARNAAELAWCCGENGEYFERMFDQLRHFMHESSQVLMVLCEGCDLDMIRNMAIQKGYQFNCILTRQNVLEKDYIYKIESAA